MYRKNLKAYTANSLQSEMSVADPYRIIQLMMQGVMERLAQAKGAIERRDFEAKSVAISKAIGLLDGLQGALDLSYGKIPQDLFSLYDYMKQRLMDASREMSQEPVDEVAKLFITIKSAWDAIPPSERELALSQKQAQEGDL
ncbi:flagellar export chaperone FliS [Pseudaeromonas paramecii]|uniref:Flagellar secretion chaperone FliS n=1 Tax=Pseudaeromonas paramecii TaxID=2138166 RepID=A0ABP8Q2U7_9GAMM